MERELLYQQVIETEERKRFLLEYHLMEHYSGETRCFGVSITKKGEGCHEYEDIPDFTCIREQALRFINIISRARVTPATLLDVAENFLALEYAY